MGDQVERDTLNLHPHRGFIKSRRVKAKFRFPLSDEERGITHTPKLMLKNAFAQRGRGNVEDVSILSQMMNGYSSVLSPQIIKDSPDLPIRRSFTVEDTDDIVAVYLCPALKDPIRNFNSGFTLRRRSNLSSWSGELRSRFQSTRPIITSC